MKEEPNQALATSAAVTIRADARLAPAALVLIFDVRQKELRV